DRVRRGELTRRRVRWAQENDDDLYVRRGNAQRGRRHESAPCVDGGHFPVAVDTNDGVRATSPCNRNGDRRARTVANGRGQRQDRSLLDRACAAIDRDG